MKGKIAAGCAAVILGVLSVASPAVAEETPLPGPSASVSASAPVPPPTAPSTPADTPAPSATVSTQPAPSPTCEQPCTGTCTLDCNVTVIVVVGQPCDQDGRHGKTRSGQECVCKTVDAGTAPKWVNVAQTKREGLPVTGSTTLAIAAGGVLLLVFGLGISWALRKRATRFTV